VYLCQIILSNIIPLVYLFNIIALDFLHKFNKKKKNHETALSLRFTLQVLWNSINSCPRAIARFAESLKVRGRVSMRRYCRVRNFARRTIFVKAAKTRYHSWRGARHDISIEKRKFAIPRASPRRTCSFRDVSGFATTCQKLSMSPRYGNTFPFRSDTRIDRW